MTFKPGHKPQHDLSAAGKRGAKNSPWRRGCTPNSALTELRYRKKEKAK